jgi:hypothetical protein
VAQESGALLVGLDSAFVARGLFFWRANAIAVVAYEAVLWDGPWRQESGKHSHLMHTILRLNNHDVENPGYDSPSSA